MGRSRLARRKTFRYAFKHHPTAHLGDSLMTMSPAARARLTASRKQEVATMLTPDIYSWYRQQLDVCRMRYDERRSSWMVFGYDEVQRVLLDTDAFSSERTLKADGSVDEIGGAGMLGLDPPRHRQLRSLVVQAFTQKRVAALEPRIQALAASLIDRVKDEEEVDIVDALAFPLPIMVIAELLEFPQPTESNSAIGPATWSHQLRT